jgi:ubiquinone/menaquinone biosynthesis C-methylase UbiE
MSGLLCHEQQSRLDASIRSIPDLTTSISHMKGNKMTTTKAYKGLPMEGIIASWYSRITLKDLSRHKLMAEKLATQIPQGASVLEIAPGPGYFCIELARLRDYHITGLDVSRSFVEIASRNAAQAGVSVDFRLGNASQLPFEDNSFDAAFCQAAFKNFTEPVKAVSEMYRVLRPHGKAIIADMRHDAGPAEIQAEVDKMGLGPIDKYMTKWTFEHFLLNSAYSISEMTSMIARTPFGQGKFAVGGVGFQVTLEK